MYNDKRNKMTKLQIRHDKLQIPHDKLQKLNINVSCTGTKHIKLSGIIR